MRPALVVLLVALFPQLVVAAQDVEIALKANAPLGEKPAVIIKVNRAVTDVELTLLRDDEKRITLHTGKLNRGQEKKLTLDQGEGVFLYEGTLTADFTDTDEPATMPLKFEATVLAPPRISVDLADVNLDERRIEVTMNRPARRVTFSVYGDDGKIIDSGEAQFENEPAGAKLPVVWQRTDATVLRVDMVGHDPHGYFSPTLSLFPWSMEIPHQDVTFETGKSEIPATEMGKVKTATADIQTAIKRYGKIVKITLYVAGHTDTVGTAESNQVLSDARAQAIARAFRKGGIKVPIRYQGAGEGDLKVATPDETDEPENRRAAYIISVEDPSSRGGWKNLD